MPYFETFKLEAAKYTIYCNLERWEINYAEQHGC